jgi:hypothetical protein
MKTLKLIIILAISVFAASCKTENISLKLLDEISQTKYYSSDIILEKFQPIYGVWKVTGTSGGFAGTGYPKDFDYLILKRNGIFGIVRNDSLINFGKLTLLTDNTMKPVLTLFCRFDFEKDTKLELNGDSEKYFELAGNDTLNLIAPCCDRYNIHLVRQHSHEGILKGKISIGPICPVETVPPRPECLPTIETYKAWQTAVWNTSKTKKIQLIHPALDGNFEVILPAGKYLIDFEDTKTNRIGGSNLPLTFTIRSDETTTLDINIDTGIR